MSETRSTEGVDERQYNKVCKDRFNRIEEKIDESDAKSEERFGRLDRSIRGNGKPGIATRLAVVEDNVKGWKKVTVGAIAAVVGIILHRIFG